MPQFPKSNQICYDSPSSEVFKNFDTNTSLDLGQNLQTSLEQAEIWFEICCRLFVVDQKSKTYFFSTLFLPCNVTKTVSGAEKVKYFLPAKLF